MKKFITIVFLGVVLSITQFKAVQALDSSVSIIGMTVEEIIEDSTLRKNVVKEAEVENATTPLTAAAINRVKRISPTSVEAASITSLKGIEHFSNITYINLNAGGKDAKLKAFPEEVFSLPNLVRLNIQGYHHMPGPIPDRFDEIPQLEVLNVQLTGIESEKHELPESLTRLPRLTSLIFGNSFIKGPTNIPNRDVLKEINGYGLKSETLPENLFVGPQLSDVNLMFNKITNLTGEEYELLQDNLINYKVRDQQKTYYFEQGISQGDFVHLSSDNLYQKLVKHNETTNFKLYKVEGNALAYVSDLVLEDHVDNKGIYIDQSISQTPGQYHSVLNVESGPFKGSRLTFNFEILQTLTREVRFISSKTKAVIGDPIYLSGPVGSFKGIPSTNIRGYAPSMYGTEELMFEDETVHYVSLNPLKVNVKVQYLDALGQQIAQEEIIEGYHEDEIVWDGLDREGYESLFDVKSLPDMFDVDMEPVVLKYKKLKEDMTSTPGDKPQEEIDKPGQPEHPDEETSTTPDQEEQKPGESDEKADDVVVVEHKVDPVKVESNKPIKEARTQDTQDTLLPPTGIRLILSQIGIVFIVIGLFIRKKSIVSK
ncbi:hypothetical protein [Erysipelothrix rhusiopathiae]|uniref:leucine-rich repeat domain-containing protein n=1 Tax=Erysipelothrix rhusiopathiae TaxID=1648 RepID=UPI002B24864B|nr:hypothetical protein [Erysipelothrix rhusiopathiae]WRB93443.1 hypothetical protein LL063_02355 [Erysipelothrix rhusiopathiae]